jgi:ectoine hydroxylase-related dioxygenase (phytanoyl-CoA dioxygenase family)
MVLSSRHFREGPKVIDELGGLEAYRQSMPCSPAEKVILDRHHVEPAFAIGDAFLFSRYVWHRSSPLLEGPLAQRLAFTMRLIAGDALYDRTLCEKFGEFSVAYGNPNVKTAFGLSFDDLVDGDQMIRSRHATDVL